MRAWPERLRALLPWSLTAVAEVAWVVPWLVCAALIDGDGAALQQLVAPLALALLGLALGMVWEGALVERWQVGERLQQVVRAVGALGLLAAGAFTGYWLWPATGVLPVLAALAAWYGWYQGSAAGAGGLEHGRLAARFGWQAPVLLLAVVCALLAGAGRVQQAGTLVGTGLLVYFGASLGALLLTRLQESLAQQAAAGDAPAGALSPGAVVVLTLGLLGLGVALASAAGAGFAGDWWLQLLEFVFRLLWLILYRIALLVLLLLQPLLNLWHRAPLAARLQLAPAQQAPEPNVPVPSAPGFTVAVQYATIIALVLVLVWLAVGLRRRKRRAPVDGEVRESIFSWSLLGEELSGWLPRRGRGRLRGGVPDAAEGLRAVYRRLQELGAAAGRPRRPGETPGQYRGALSGRLAAGAVGLITTMYEALRYGGQAPDAQGLAGAQQALRELEQPTDQAE